MKIISDFNTIKKIKVVGYKNYYWVASVKEIIRWKLQDLCIDQIPIYNGAIK